MARAMWKGAISFGLVNIHVALYPAVRQDEIDFDWLDKRTMDPVGYKRANKRTGKEIDKENIVSGVEQTKGEYVVLSDDKSRPLTRARQGRSVPKPSSKRRTFLSFIWSTLLPPAGGQRRGEGLCAAARSVGGCEEGRRRALRAA